MPVIRDANTLIGFLDRGEIVRDTMKATAELVLVLKEYSDMLGPKAKVKGKVKLEIDLECQNGMMSIFGDVTIKAPKKPRGSTTFWVTEDGELSTEHPQQHDMFKPKDVPLSGERGPRMSS
jgi:hypothetical protein